MDATILYAEDDDDLRSLVRNQLTAEGFVVQTANNGEEAIGLLALGTFDLVLLDIRMPRVDGLQVLMHMKEHKIRSRVVMLTAVDDLAVALKAVRLGANDYVTKPYSLETLLSCIHRVLQR
jgi:DNA-binding response OmpR family regulator